jgi:hypothetical protein
VKYEVGDRVKIWKIFGYPVGTVSRYIEETDRYLVDYLYQDGTPYSEEFDRVDLALFEKGTWVRDKCQCGLLKAPSGGKHADYCHKRGQLEKGIEEDGTKDERNR